MSIEQLPIKKLQTPNFFIGSLPVYGNAVLAPMDGITDLPFRNISRKMGSAYSVTEFINAIDVINGNPYLYEKISYTEFERPISFQIFDNEVSRIVEAAKRLRVSAPDMIDLNIGCSVKKVSRRGAGAGLLLDPEKIARMMRALTENLDIPVTAKIRLGWDSERKNFQLISKIIEDNGGALISVHGRTKDQAFSGPVDFEAIAQIKKLVHIPVIANGDIQSIEDKKTVIESTGCDAVMIGRAAIGNPWLFSDRERNNISSEELFHVITDHLDRMIEFYGADRGIILFRKHLVKYIKPNRISRESQRKLLTEIDRDVLLTRLQNELLTE